MSFMMQIDAARTTPDRQLADLATAYLTLPTGPSIDFCQRALGVDASDRAVAAYLGVAISTVRGWRDIGKRASFPSRCPHCNADPCACGRNVPPGSRVTLDELAVAYRMDREAMDRAHPPARVNDHCRYCGKYHLPWVGSAFDEHVRCAVSPEFKKLLVAALNQSPEISFKHVAAALGVTYAVARAWWRHDQGIPFR